MYHYVYEITNLVNGKKYIGKRSCKCPIEEDHYMGSGTLLKNDYKEIGIDKFKKNILAICDNEQMAYELEFYFICKRNAIVRDDYYNEYLYPVNINLNKNVDENTLSFRKKVSKKMKGVNLKGNSPRARKVICVTTSEVFGSMSEASEKYKISYRQIGRCCTGQNKIGGKHPITGQPLKWMYYEEYLKSLNEKEVS